MPDFKTADEVADTLITGIRHDPVIQTGVAFISGRADVHPAIGTALAAIRWETDEDAELDIDLINEHSNLPDRMYTAIEKGKNAARFKPKTTVKVATKGATTIRRVE